MNVIIYHSYIPHDAPPDEKDVLDEAEFFKINLETLGYNVVCKSFPFDFRELNQDKEKYHPVFIVNLVETIHNDGRLIHVAPSFFDHMNIPYTGCSSEAIYLSSNKLTGKLVLNTHNIDTPAFLTLSNIDYQFEKSAKYLLKSVWEHASVGLDEEKIKLLSDKNAIKKNLETALKKGKEIFAEAYIEGREFNIAMLGGKNGPEVMHPAEIKFINFPDDKLKIVGYRAKWIEDSFEYQNTVRSFDFEEADNELLDRLKEICLKCWQAFNLKGYARVDFRVDKYGKPFVLEINTNPCISPDSGFIAAINRKGVNMYELFERIIYDTLH